MSKADREAADGWAERILPVVLSAIREEEMYAESVAYHAESVAYYTERVRSLKWQMQEAERLLALQQGHLAAHRAKNRLKEQA